MSPQALWAKIHARFLQSRLAQVPAVSVMGVMIGKLLAAAEKRGLNWRVVVVANLPTKVEVARRSWGLTPRDEAAIQFSREQSATAVTDMAARAKEQIGAAITRELAAGKTAPAIAAALAEEYGALNRDWRRVALTETATAVSNGYLAQIEPGEIVVGDAAVDCCPWCRRHLQGRAYRMLPAAPAAPTAAESLYCVWLGKTNVGRSRYPVKADGSLRSAGELWHPCIPAHPHCRCRWRRFDPRTEVIEPETHQVHPKEGFDMWSKQ